MIKIKYRVLLTLSILVLTSCGSLKKIETNIDSKILNKGVSGNTTVNLLKRLEVDVLKEKPDLVILMVGTNDLLNSKKIISYQEYAANLTKIVQTIKSKNCEVLMMSPPTADSVYLYQRHDKSLYVDTPNTMMNKAREIVKVVSKENRTFYVDIYSSFIAKEIPKHNEDVYIRNVKNSGVKDGVHPTPVGYKFIAETVFKYLKENKLLNKYKTIICFGDSITKGAGAKGAGTITGENYPSFLNTMIINHKTIK
jgi:lysophospholipase L1-like esterase